MSTEGVESVSDKEIFEEAIETDPVEAEESDEATVEDAPVVEEGRQRDEFGRFVAKEQPTEAAPIEPEQTKPVEEKDHRIPLMELLNEREKRQAEQRRAEALAQEIAILRQQVQPQQQPQIPDQFADPDQYNAFWMHQIQNVQAQFQQQLRAVQAENSLARAHERYGDVFEKGYQEVLDRAAQGDREAAQKIASSPNPGEAIVQWYKREQTLQQVGTDPQAYAQKILEDALSNPEFLAKALEKAKGVAQQQPNQQIKLPPSLNKATSAGTRQSDTDPMSDAALFHHAIGR
jgi:hypothetical protein